MIEESYISIAHLVAAKAARTPDFAVLTFEHQGETETRTYAQLWTSGQKLAARLRRLGAAKGDRFAVLLKNHPEFVECMVASAILGTVLVPIDPRTRGQKLAFMLAHSDAIGMVCAGYNTGQVTEALGMAEAPSLDWLLTIDGQAPAIEGMRTASFTEIMAADAPEPEIEIAAADLGEPMQMMYTSGTTGDPKGIVIPHARFAYVATHGGMLYGYRKDDRPYTGLSLTHGNAQFLTLATSLLMELHATISRQFTKSRLWDILREHRCTTFALLGGMTTAIFAEPERPDDADNPVRLVVSAGMPATIWDAFEKRFDLKLFEFYGAMEGGQLVKPVGEGPIGSCGKPPPGVIARLVDEDFNDVPTGEPGEIVFRRVDGPMPPVNYHKAPQASAKTSRDGWLRSGDIMTQDADGWFFYQHRKGGGIRHNGEFVNSAFVERTLAEHPAVDDVFVYGVPAANGAPGEKDVTAAIVARGSLDPVEVFAWAEARLERNMVPSHLQLVDAIPKTASEKPQERFLLAMFNDPAGRVFTNQEVKA